MNFYSTNNSGHKVDFEKAVMNGLAPDGGLYMPSYLPILDKQFLVNLNKYSIVQIAFEIIKNFTGQSINENDLREIVEKSFTFEAPNHMLDENTYILELFHGPTLAFKDFGARFMARTMEYFVRKEKEPLNILVATSGDTGSAVANGFYNVEGINVFILYPSNKVSLIQEKQLTTLDKNVTALEIDGTFDDCQKLVKEAFVDPELTKKMRLSSANSINIARLLPQSVYYFESYKQLPNKSKKTIYTVPSGNLGNLTAGLFAHKMGLPIDKFIGATNSNKVFTEYINTGKFNPVPSKKTYSNAMDVGNPSNLARIEKLYDTKIDSIRTDIFSISHDDYDTVKTMKTVYEKYNYIIDPHGAVGYVAAKDYELKFCNEEVNSVILETAHPSKFKEIVEETLSVAINIPGRLKECLVKEKKSVGLSNRFEDLKSFLLSR